MELRQLLCKHRFADINLKCETKDGICVFTNKCVKCGKEYRAEIPEKNLYKEHKERAV